MNEEIKSAIEAGLAEVKSKVETATKETASQFEAKMAEVQSKLDEAKSAGVDKETIEKMQEHLDSLDIKMQKVGKNGGSEDMSLKDAFATISGDISKSLGPEAKSQSDIKAKFEMKAVGNISFGNFLNGSYGLLNTQTLPGVERVTPLQDFWFRNIFPTAQTDSEVIQFLKYVGGEGAAAIWDERAETLVEKPLVDLDFDKASENVVWIAALANAHRGMLMDAPFLNSFVPQELVYGERGLLVAENAYIWAKLVANSTAYSGSLTNPLERVYDAAFGQLKDYRRAASHILMNNRDELKYIAFNKASGSGEYDLPIGSVTVVNGKLQINGVTVLGTPDIPVGKFMAIDNRVGTFFNRLSPEVEVSNQHKDNFSKNMVTFRAEERVALMVKNNKGVIYGDLNASATTTTTTV